METLKLLQQRDGTQRPVALDSIMPNGLLEVLIHRGPADASVLDDAREALRLGYRFDSYRDRYQPCSPCSRNAWAYHSTVSNSGSSSTLPNVSHGSTAPTCVPPPPCCWSNRPPCAASCSRRDELKNRYLGGRGRDASLNKADGALQEILASSGYPSRPAELLDGDGYGLPQTREWTRPERESEQRQLRLNQLTEELDQKSGCCWAMSDARNSKRSK